MGDATAGMAQHTPGPWQWVFRDNGKDAFLIHPGHGWLTVMDFARRGMQGGTFRLATWEGGERGSMGGIMRPAHEVDVANHPDARLIAAAPELLAALEELVSLYEAPRDEIGGVERLVLGRVRAAIAKARGVTGGRQRGAGGGR